MKMSKKGLIYLIIAVLAAALIFAAVKFVIPMVTDGGETKASGPSTTQSGTTTQPSTSTQPGTTTQPSTSTQPGTTTSPVITTSGPSQASSVFPLRVSDNKRFFIDQNGDPYLIFADTGWMLFSYISKDDAVFYLDQRHDNGVNTILCYAAPFKVGTPDAEGEIAFIGNDLSKPNDAYFDHVDYIIQLAAQRGMQVIICPAEMDSYNSYYTTENARELGRYFGSRYKDHKNIMWFVGGDVHPTERQKIISDSLALGIREYDTSHLISFHPAGGASSSDFFNGYSWLDYNMIQVYTADSPKSYTSVSSDYAKSPVRPQLLIEPCYEDNAGNTPYQVRRSISWGFTSGGSGLCYGNWIIYRYRGESEGYDWKSHLDGPAFMSVSYMYECFKEYDWSRLVPGKEKSLLAEGLGKWGGLDYATAALADDGSFSIIYLPTARDIVVDLSNFTSPDNTVSVKWFDPTNGTFSHVGEYPNAGTLTVPSQPANSAGDPDWFLIIE